MATYYVGLDVHLKHTTICILDQDGKRVKRLTIRGVWSKIADELKRLPGKVLVCYDPVSRVGRHTSPPIFKVQSHHTFD